MSAVAAALFVGGWGADGFLLFALVNGPALTAVAAATLTLNAERRGPTRSCRAS